MPLTANREVQRYVDQELRGFLVATNVHIYKGALVGLNRSTGYARPLVAGDQFLGVAYEEIDNTAGANGAKTARVYTQGDFILPVSGLLVTNTGATAYALDDTFATLSPGVGGSPIGRAIGWVSDGVGIVRIEPALSTLVEQSVQAPLASLTTGAAVNPVLIAQRPITIISMQVVFNTKPDAGALDVGTDDTNPNQQVNNFNLTTLTNNIPATLTLAAAAVAKGARVWARVGQASSTAGKGGLLSVRYIEAP